MSASSQSQIRAGPWRRRPPAASPYFAPPPPPPAGGGFVAARAAGWKGEARCAELEDGNEDDPSEAPASRDPYPFFRRGRPAAPAAAAGQDSAAEDPPADPYPFYSRRAPPPLPPPPSPPAVAAADPYPGHREGYRHSGSGGREPSIEPPPRRLAEPVEAPGVEHREQPPDCAGGTRARPLLRRGSAEWTAPSIVSQRHRAPTGVPSFRGVPSQRAFPPNDYDGADFSHAAGHHLYCDYESAGAAAAVAAAPHYPRWEYEEHPHHQYYRPQHEGSPHLRPPRRPGEQRQPPAADATDTEMAMPRPEQQMQQHLRRGQEPSPEKGHGSQRDGPAAAAAAAEDGYTSIGGRSSSGRSLAPESRSPFSARRQAPAEVAALAAAPALATIVKRELCETAGEAAYGGRERSGVPVERSRVPAEATEGGPVATAVGGAPTASLKRELCETTDEAYSGSDEEDDSRLHHGDRGQRKKAATLENGVGLSPLFAGGAGRQVSGGSDGGDVARGGSRDVPGVPISDGALPPLFRGGAGRRASGGSTGGDAGKSGSQDVAVGGSSSVEVRAGISTPPQVTGSAGDLTTVAAAEAAAARATAASQTTPAFPPQGVMELIRGTTSIDARARTSAPPQTVRRAQEGTAPAALASAAPRPIAPRPAGAPASIKSSFPPQGVLELIRGNTSGDTARARTSTPPQGGGGRRGEHMAAAAPAARPAPAPMAPKAIAPRSDGLPPRIKSSYPPQRLLELMRIGANAAASALGRPVGGLPDVGGDPGGKEGQAAVAAVGGAGAVAEDKGSKNKEERERKRLRDAEDKSLAHPVMQPAKYRKDRSRQEFARSRKRIRGRFVREGAQSYVSITQLMGNRRAERERRQQSATGAAAAAAGAKATTVEAR